MLIGEARRDDSQPLDAFEDLSRSSCAACLARLRASRAHVGQSGWATNAARPASSADNRAGSFLEAVGKFGPAGEDHTFARLFGLLDAVR